MNRPVVPLALLLGLICTAAKAPPQPIGPAEAVAMAEAARPAQGEHGRFRMTVAATGQVGGATFLNSAPDYRAPDDLSLRLSPNVVKALTRRYGEAPLTYLRGRTVTVDGVVRREMIVDADHNRPIGFNRWQHTVRVLLPGQIVSVE
jgi:hypothetical protein